MGRAGFRQIFRNDVRVRVGLGHDVIGPLVRACVNVRLLPRVHRGAHLLTFPNAFLQLLNKMCH